MMSRERLFCGTVLLIALSSMVTCVPVSTSPFKTVPTLQVVVNPLLLRDSPVHNQIFASLEALNANYVRFVPWFPYPKLSVAQLDPPSGDEICRSAPQGYDVVIDCGVNQTIANITFASYGTPTTCADASLNVSACNAENSTAIVNSLCLGKSSCIISVPTDRTLFGDPCYGVRKLLTVSAQCTIRQRMHSGWDFSWIEPILEDFFQAISGTKQSIINFSTPPTWLYETDDYSYPQRATERDPSYEQGSVLRDPTRSQLAMYYKNLLSWLMDGGFHDEYGNFYEGHRYNFTHWEILNEPEAEHSHTVQEYTYEYDAIVSAIRSNAGPSSKLKFVGMALSGHYEWDWYNFFLNASNHLIPNPPLDMISFHFYASCSNRTDVNSYTQFFQDADRFVQEVAQVIDIRNRLSPSTMLNVDETGVILPDDNDPNAPMFPLVYYNAAAAMYAYLFGELSIQGLDILGESQLVGYPEMPELNLVPEFPSVAMLNWTTGAGNARYWVLKMLLQNIGEEQGTVAALNSTTPAVAVFQFTLPTKSVTLVVNKGVSTVNVDLKTAVAGLSLPVCVVNEDTGNGPPVCSTLTPPFVLGMKRFAVAILVAPSM